MRSDLHIIHDVLITWFPVEEAPHGRETLGKPIVVESIPRRRAWTAKRDLMAASHETECWREPSSLEYEIWDLSQLFPGHRDDATATFWLVATTGEPGLGVPTRMAVRLQEIEVLPV